MRPATRAGYRAWACRVLFRPYWESFADIFERFGPQLFAVLVFRAPVAASVFPLAREYAPQARLVFNTVDLHFLRAERKAAMATGEAPEKSFARDRELALIRTADSTIVVSEFERQLLSELAPEASVNTIPIAREAPDVAPRPFTERRDILFIGGFRHTPNVDAIVWFVHQVWPILRARGFVDNLLLVGSNMPEEIRALSRRAGIVAYGHVPGSTAPLPVLSPFDRAAPLWGWREREGRYEPEFQGAGGGVFDRR